MRMVVWALLLLDQHGGIGTDALLPTGEAQLLGGGGLDGDVVGISTHHFGQDRFHLRDMGIQLGMLRTDRGVDIAQLITRLTNQGHRLTQEDLAVDVLIFAGGIWEMVTNIS